MKAGTRDAHNFAKERLLSNRRPHVGTGPERTGTVPRCHCILDPAPAKAWRLLKAAHALGRGQVKAYAVEYDAEARSPIARGLVDRCLPQAT